MSEQHEFVSERAEQRRHEAHWADVHVQACADAVVKAAEEWKAAWHNQRYYPRGYEKAREALADAVDALDKAKAEQAKEASRG